MSRLKGTGDLIPSSGAKSKPSKGVDHSSDVRVVNGNPFGDTGSVIAETDAKSRPEGKVPPLSNTGRERSSKFG